MLIEEKCVKYYFLQWKHLEMALWSETFHTQLFEEFSYDAMKLQLIPKMQVEMCSLNYFYM